MPRNWCPCQANLGAVVGGYSRSQKLDHGGHGGAREKRFPPYSSVSPVVELLTSTRAEYLQAVVETLKSSLSRMPVATSRISLSTLRFVEIASSNGIETILFP